MLHTQRNAEKRCGKRGKSVVCSIFSFSHNVFENDFVRGVKNRHFVVNSLAVPNYKFLDPSKLKELTDDNFEFDFIGGRFSKMVENTVEKREIALLFLLYF